MRTGSPSLVSLDGCFSVVLRDSVDAGMSCVTLNNSKVLIGTQFADLEARCLPAGLRTGLATTTLRRSAALHPIHLKVCLACMHGESVKSKDGRLFGYHVPVPQPPPSTCARSSSPCAAAAPPPTPSRRPSSASCRQRWRWTPAQHPQQQRHQLEHLQQQEHFMGKAQLRSPHTPRKARWGALQPRTRR